MTPLFRKVDCVRLPVTDLDAAITFYRDSLGHEIRWRTPTSVGLGMPESDAEIVVHTEGGPPETDLLVDQQDVTPLGLAYQAIELNTVEDPLDATLRRVLRAMKV